MALAVKVFKVAASARNEGGDDECNDGYEGGTCETPKCDERVCEYGEVTVEEATEAALGRLGPGDHRLRDIAREIVRGIECDYTLSRGSSLEEEYGSRQDAFDEWENRVDALHGWPQGWYGELTYEAPWSPRLEGCQTGGTSGASSEAGTSSEAQPRLLQLSSQLSYFCLTFVSSFK